MIRTNFNSANLSGCKIYGISAWDLQVNDQTVQSNMIITQIAPNITVDDIEVAQFVYLMINNRKIRNVIDTLTGKAVLIIGRFGERKKILDTIADQLRKRNYLPIMFDFARPVDRDTTETIKILAGLCKFVIADFTFPQSVPHEAANIIPLFKIPFIPLIQEAERPFSMSADYESYPWYIRPVSFKDIQHLIAIMDMQILLPAEERHQQLRMAKSE